MHNQNTISIAKIDDTDEIMKFIDNEWKQGHILGNNKDYFLYEYKNNDHLRKKIAKKGKKKYMKYFNSTIVADYIINNTFDIKYNKSKYLWDK